MVSRGPGKSTESMVTVTPTPPDTDVRAQARRSDRTITLMHSKTQAENDEQL